MSQVKEYISKRSTESSTFKKHFELEKKRLNLAKKMLDLRLASGLTQAQLAAKIGKPQSTISRIETGEMNPTIELIVEIAMGLDKTVELNFVEKNG